MVGSAQLLKTELKLGLTFLENMVRSYRQSQIAVFEEYGGKMEVEVWLFVNRLPCWARFTARVAV